MPSTTRGYVTPSASDNADVPGDMLTLAASIDSDVGDVADAVATGDAASTAAGAAAVAAHSADLTDVHGITDTASLREQIGVRDSVIRRGFTSVAGAEARTNTAYGLLATPDRLQNVVLPTNGLLVVAFQALVKESVGGAGRAAIFLGSNQLKRAAADGAPAVQESGSMFGGGVADSYVTLSTSEFGLTNLASVAAGEESQVTTGQVLGVNSAGGPTYIFAAAGIYDVSIQFKASSGSITAKDRKLWVWTMGF